VVSPASGLHVRASNAMGRTRDGLLDAALVCLTHSGWNRLTMSSVAARAGVSKGTLYNHFRTLDELLLALVDRELDRIYGAAKQAAERGGVASGLECAASRLADYSVVRIVGGLPPDVLVAMSAPGDSPRWQRARADVADLLGGRADSPLVDVALRWLASQVASPVAPDLRARSATVLAGRRRGAVVSGLGRRKVLPAD
jgi:AcrR family transcriptional regulator